MATHFISYGIGREYLKEWSTKEALREVFQNYIDYGQYQLSVVSIDDDNVKITIHNSWQPSNLNFLKVGESKKDSEDSVGKYGEGLKMAFLIFVRNGYKAEMIFRNYIITGGFDNDPDLGEVFHFECNSDDVLNSDIDIGFTIEIVMPEEEYIKFDNIILPEDTKVLYSDPYYGDIIALPETGNIYIGGIFVIKAEKMRDSYNFRPGIIGLGRNRDIPNGFDINWYASKIQDGYGKFTAVDTTYDDIRYSKTAPKTLVETVKPTIIENSVEFVSTTDDGKVKTVIQNNDIKNSLIGHPRMKEKVTNLNKVIKGRKSASELVNEFRKKYVRGNQMEIDFDILIERMRKV